MMERGAPMPSWMEDIPSAESSDAFYHTAFHELSTLRQLGFTVGPIPVPEIRRYHGAQSFCSVMMEAFVTIIRAMDETYREWAESERKKAQKKNSGVASSHIGATRERQAK